MTNEPARPSVPLDEARLGIAMAEFVKENPTLNISVGRTSFKLGYLAAVRVRAEEAAPRSPLPRRADRDGRR